MNKLEPKIARKIIEIVGGFGIPPEYGVQFFTVGLEPYLSVIENEYLATFIKEGGSTFKMVIGTYGGGKTHFLYCVRKIAWSHNFAVSYVSLKPDSCPFHQLEQVYSEIVRNITPPLRPEELISENYEKGICSIIRRWFNEKFQEFSKNGLSGEDLKKELLNYLNNIRDIESSSFENGIKSAFKALLYGQEDDFNIICAWLKGEPYNKKIHQKFGILEKIDKTKAFLMIRSLTEWIKKIGYSGLVILFDEAELRGSLSGKQKEHLLANLRHLIDECSHTFKSVMFFYAVPDENFLEGRELIYEALKQRVNTVFDNKINPSGVKIYLEKLGYEPIEFLREIGSKLTQIYEVAYNHKFDNASSNKTIELVAEKAYNDRYMDISYKRLFVQMLIKALHFLKEKGRPPSEEELKNI